MRHWDRGLVVRDWVVSGFQVISRLLAVSKETPCRNLFPPWWVEFVVTSFYSFSLSLRPSSSVKSKYFILILYSLVTCFVIVCVTSWADEFVNVFLIRSNALFEMTTNQVMDACPSFSKVLCQCCFVVWLFNLCLTVRVCCLVCI